MDVLDTAKTKDKVEDLQVKHEKQRNEVKRNASIIKNIKNKVRALQAGGSDINKK